jgi:uncharacterized membrane protein
MLPVTQRDAQLAPAIPPVEPSPRFAARVASGIFAGQALMLFVISVLPPQGSAWAARLVIAALCAVFAVALHMTSERIGPLVLRAVEVQACYFLFSRSYLRSCSIGFTDGLSKSPSAVGRLNN